MTPTSPRLVQFSPLDTVLIYEIESLKEVEEEELESRWYSHFEQVLMKDQARYDAKLSKEHLEEQEKTTEKESFTSRSDQKLSIETRGIEHMISEHRLGVMKRRAEAAVQTVLFQQEEQRMDKDYDAELIAALYEDISAPCAKEAHIRGLQDAEDVPPLASDECIETNGS